MNTEYIRLCSIPCAGEDQGGEGMIRVFPTRTKWTPTDNLAFVGDPPLFRPKEQPVMVSVSFTWDIEEGKRLFRAWSEFFPDVQIGGPAFGDAGDDFVSGRYIKAGVTITSRGCPKRCEGCFVSSREGKTRELPIVDGNIVQDNNLLACSRKHIEAVCEMLKRQKKAAIFSGGLDVDFLCDWHINLFLSMRIAALWFACDHYKAIKKVREIVPMLADFPKYKRRCYCMIGKDETYGQAKERLEAVYAMGFFPFAQLYRGDSPISYSQAWKDLARKWSRPAAYNTEDTDHA